MTSPPVRVLHQRGFPLGPPPESACAQCADAWGDHLLHPLDEQNPLGGGTYSCPVGDCVCFGTWGVTGGFQGGICDHCDAVTRFPTDPQPNLCHTCWKG